MDGTTIPTVLAITGVFALLIIETAHSIRAQERAELDRQLDAAADRVAAARRAARHAENLLTLQYFAGNDSPATRIAERKWLQAALHAPAVDPGPIRTRGRTLR